MAVLNGKSNQFNNDIYQVAIQKILSMKTMSKSLRETIVKKLNQFDDLRFYFYKNTLLSLKQEKLSSSCLKVLLDILLELEPASKENVKTLNDSIYQEGSADSKKNSFLKYAVYKKAFSECWIMLLSHEMDQSIYACVLDILHSKVIPNLTDPTALMDFLVDAYNSGKI